MDLEEQLRKARALSDVSEEQSSAFAQRVLQQLKDKRASGSRYRVKRSLRRRLGEVSAAAAALFIVVGGFGLYEVKHVGRLPFVTSASGNAPVQIGTTMVDPTDPGTFSRATLLKLRSDLNQYKLATRPQDHEVYVLTGGLGTADPQIPMFDSFGNMTFQAPGAAYWITEQVQSPSLWRVQSHSATSAGIAMGDPPPSDGPLLAWVRHETKSGQTYYEWTASKDLKYMYFRKGRTYVVVTIQGFSRSMKSPVKEQAIINHLVPIGNPVTK